MLFTHDWADINVHCLRMAYSENIESVGAFSITKVTHLFSLIWKTCKIRLRHRPKILYYLPASANKIPIIRDIIFLAAVRWLFKKTIWHFHAGGLPEYLEKHPIIRTLAKPFYSKPSLSIELYKADLPAGAYFKAQKNVIIPNGLDIEVLKPTQSSDAFNILYVGAISPGKGVLDIIKTAKILKRSEFLYKIRLVGEASSKDFYQEVEREIKKNELTDVIEFSGSLTGKKKLQAYAWADCFFFPSHYEAENLPLVLIEAMAYALPIVTTRWRGIPQLIGDSKCALLFDTKASDQYGRGILRLMQDDVLRSQMSASARKHYQDNFTREKFIDRMTTEFRTLCNHN